MQSTAWSIAVLGHANCLGDRSKLEALAISKSKFAKTQDSLATLDKIYFCLVTDRDDKHDSKPVCYKLDGLEVHIDLLPFPNSNIQDQSRSLSRDAWNYAAKHAQEKFSPQCMLLLNAGYHMGTDNWLSSLKEEMQHRSTIHCLAISTLDEPGLPLCVAIRNQHLQLFETLLPLGVEGADAGDYLFELYRRVGGSGSSKLAHLVETAIGTRFSNRCANGTVDLVMSEDHSNILSFKQRNGKSVAPSVTNGKPSFVANIIASALNTPVVPSLPPALSNEGYLLPTTASNKRQPSRYLDQLERSARILRTSLQRHTVSVDVLIPSYRIEYDALYRIVTAPYNAQQADVKFVLQIDNPSQPAAVCAALTKLRHRLQHQLIIRKNLTNLGASGARSRALDASAAEFCIFFDDDVQPTAMCIDAYVSAFLKHPQAAAFAGPTFLPRLPQVMPVAIHMSGVTDFWEIPVWFGSHVPWAVTANVAYKNTLQRFDPRFPKTGGGEDVDFCVRLGAKAVAVPQAVALHHWWPGNRVVLYRRFFKWFEGDGHLILLHPHLSYLVLPSAVMCILALLLCGALRVFSFRGALLASAAVWLVDAVFEQLLQSVPASRRRRHPCPPLMRPHAALESSLIKTVSEFGRLYGHIKVGRYFSMLRKFDWFCGYNPTVVTFEQALSVTKLVCFTAAAVPILMHFGALGL